ncbi:MAG: PEP-CTERM sorting domain-containing protein, partial [Phycisphaerae bacterium]
GHFYESTLANSFNQFGNGIIDIQVPGSAYLDGDLSRYTFDVTQTGTSASWTWGNIVNPGLLTTIHNGTNGGLSPSDPGYVFELGLAVAFVQVPEPTTLSLLAMGTVALLRRRRRR